MPKGRLNPERSGYDMPVDAPLYAKPPIDYRDVHAIAVTYETDEDAVLDILPEGLEIAQPLASINFIQYPFSTLGPYNEVILGIPCLFEGKPRFYIPHIVLDSDVPLAAGREIWGYPKKLAAITIETEARGNDILWGRMERPAGNPIVSAGVRPETALPVTGEATDGYSMGLRVIPSPAEGEPPSLAELIDVHTTSTVKAHWQGPGWVEFHNHSELDPWYRLEVKRVVSATYRVNDMILGFGRVVRKY